MAKSITEILENGIKRVKSNERELEYWDPAQLAEAQRLVQAAPALMTAQTTYRDGYQ